MRNADFNTVEEATVWVKPDDSAKYHLFSRDPKETCKSRCQRSFASSGHRSYAATANKIISEIEACKVCNDAWGR